MIRIASFPRAWVPPPWVDQIVGIFRRHERRIDSGRIEALRSSREVLAILAGDLEGVGFHIEHLEHSSRRVPRQPLSAGASAAQHCHVDVYHPQWHCCIAIEDGPTWTKDAMDGDGVEPLLVADADTLCLAVPAVVGGTGSLGSAQRASESEYDRALALAQVVYTRSRTYLPHRLVLIGY